MSKIDIDKFIEHLVKLGALDCNDIQSALFNQGLIFNNWKIQKIGEEISKPKWSEEDEKHLETLDAILLDDEKIGGKVYIEITRWLKSLKKRMEE